MVITYPWEKLKPGEGFFVPGLDVEKIKELGLRASVPYKYRTQAFVGIRKGLIGVWFYRKPLSPFELRRSLAS
jgi:hypothetical protein